MKPYLVAILVFIAVTSIGKAAPSLGCNICRYTIDTLYNFLTSNSTMGVLERFAKRLCGHFDTREYCDLAVTTFLPVLGAIFDLFNSTVICSRRGFCDDPLIVPDEDSIYLSRVLRSTPPSKHLSKVANQSGTFKVLVFTDAHSDFGYQEGKSIHCQFTICCRVDSPDAKDPSERAGPFGHVGGCDIPKRSLDTFLDKVGEINPDLVLWLGDNPAHDTYEQKKETHLNVLNYIAKELKNRYNGPVYLVTGNHDSLPDGQFDVRNGKNQWVLDGFAEVAKSWYSPEGYISMKKYGRFSESLKGTKLRIIGLNNFVMDFTNSFLFANATDAMGQLRWLEEELVKAEQNEEKVLIMGHVAPQSKSGERTWGYRYTALMERYASLIVGQFYGHMHEDYFLRVKSLVDPSRTVNVIQVHPSLTTFSSLNPSFRLYEMDKETYQLLNYNQYRLMVEEANKKGKAEWNVSFNFRDYYEVQSMEPSEYDKILERMKSDREYLAKVYKAHYADGPKGGVPNDTQSINYMLCRYSSGNFYEFDKCVGGKYPGKNDYMRLAIVSKHLFPDWRIAIPNPH